MSVSAFPYGNFEAAQELAVDASGNSINNIRFNATCYAGVSFAIDENEYNNAGDAGDSTVDSNFVQKYVTGGSNDDVWVERVINSGSLNHIDPGTGRHNLGTERKFAIVRSSVGTHACNLTLNFYDAASGGSLIETETFDLDVEFTV